MKIRMQRGGRCFAAAALPLILLSGCEEGEMEREAVTDGDAITVYSDPGGRFAFAAPEGLTIELLAGGRILHFHDETGEPLLQAEIDAPDPEALDHVPIEQHGGDLWLAHLLWRIQAWCAADGPTGTQYCTDQTSVEEVPGSGGPTRAVEVVPLRTREDFAAGTSESIPIGPVWGVALAEDPGALLLMITPIDREPVTEAQRDYSEAILRAVDRGLE